MLPRKPLPESFNRLPGLLICTVIAIVASYVGHLLPIVGAPITAIVLGIVVSPILGKQPVVQPGLAFTSRRILQLAIILLGANLNLSDVWKTGSQSFWVMVGSLAVALTGGTLIGNLLRLPTNIIRLITVGTSICGASAISAVAPIVGAEESEIAYAISTIFLFNIVAVFLFPLIGHLLHFSSREFGIWAGTAVNDTSSVVAAGYSFSHAAGQYATVVKLTRSLAIIPVSLWFAVVSSMAKQRDATSEPKRSRRISFPVFILGFILMSIIDTLGMFGHAGAVDISHAGQYLISVALASVGLSINPQSFMKTSWRPLAMGLCTWGLVAVSSLIFQGVI